MSGNGGCSACYNRAVVPTDILDKLRRQPFQPLRVHLSDGSAYDIPEPGYAAIARTEMYIGVKPDETGLPTRSVYCDTRHVTRIEPLSTPKPNGN